MKYLYCTCNTSKYTTIQAFHRPHEGRHHATPQGSIMLPGRAGMNVAVYRTYDRVDSWDGASPVHATNHPNGDDHGIPSLPTHSPERSNRPQSVFLLGLRASLALTALVWFGSCFRQYLAFPSCEGSGVACCDIKSRKAGCLLTTSHHSCDTALVRARGGDTDAKPSLKPPLPLAAVSNEYAELILLAFLTRFCSTASLFFLSPRLL